MSETETRTPRPEGAFHVGDWLAEPSLNRLTSGSSVRRIRPQLMDMLVTLASHHGCVVSKETLLAEVWPDRFIAEPGLVRCIAELRQELGDDSREPTYIETIAKRGYRLVAPVEWVDERGSRGHESAVRPPGGEAAAPGERRRWSMLRRIAVVGGVAGVAVVLAAIAASRRPLARQDTVVLAFENATGDEVLNEALPLALAIQLEQSPYLHVLPEARVAETLSLMKRSPDTPISRKLGLEVCERAGASAVIVGSVSAFGQNHAVGLEAIACANGESIARQQVEVNDKNAMLSGLSETAAGIRRLLGESRASVRAYQVPLTKGTTASLEALREVRRGDASRDRGRTIEALQHYRQAVSLDPEFALAQSRLGSLALNAGFETEGQAALGRAYASRSAVTLPERLEIEAIYHMHVTGDWAATGEALETLTRVYPSLPVPHHQLAALYLNTGRYDKALSEARAHLRLEPKSALALAQIAWALLYSGRLDEARQTVDSAIALGVDDERLRSVGLQVGLLTGDSALVGREREWAAGHPQSTGFILEIEAEDAVWHGQLARALAFLDRFQAWLMERTATYWAASIRLRMARYEAICGASADAVVRMDRVLAADASPGLRIEALKVTVSAGNLERTAELLDELVRAGVPGSAHRQTGIVLAANAAIDTGNGHPEAAIERLDPTIPYELGIAWGFIPLHERARALLAAGRWQDALAAFQRMLAHPTIQSGQKLLPLARLGEARALATGGRIQESRRAYDAFLALWKDADPDLPLLAQARSERAALR